MSNMSKLLSSIIGSQTTGIISWYHEVPLGHSTVIGGDNVAPILSRIYLLMFSSCFSDLPTFSQSTYVTISAVGRQYG
jgi:hypothetical protein